ncbi:hypothetical protein X769_09970 [Mesorhizobium sp. LSJC268A00]|nr:hypothetical protein X769_09970 [Mesorhizobium sp. LSJC268A00]ESZ17559.1 hypothetical protein X735_01915 [Mesorhizobium sp. L2C085B000]
MEAKMSHRRARGASQEKPPDVGDEIDGLSAELEILWVVWWSWDVVIYAHTRQADGPVELISMARREKNPIVFV